MIKTIAWIVGTMMIVIVAVAVVRSFGDTVDTVHKEFSSSALLKKYEYFKDVSASIDKKRADLEAYKSELSGYKVTDKDSRFYFEQRKSEALGLLSSYNGLVAEYNSAMSKFNYRFCNAGTMPASNLDPLPREYKPYILNLK